jgi:ribosomal protein S18 acetylase RimI-like enzyme
MMIAVDGEHYREQRDRMYPQLKSLFDVAFGVGWDDMEDEAQPGEFYIDSLSVAEPYRNQGVGTALIEHAKNIANQLHIPTVTLAVEPMNTAQQLYRKLGFSYQRTITIFNEEYHLYATK